MDDGVHAGGADPVDGAAHGGQPLGQVAEHIDVVEPHDPDTGGDGVALLPQGDQHVQGLVVAGKQQGGAGRRGPDQGADGGNIVRLGHHMGFEAGKGGGRGPEALIPPPLGVDIDAGLLLLGGIDVDEAAVIPAGGVADGVAHGGLLPL